MIAARSPSNSAFPAGPSEPPIAQTLRWLLRPISFLESCRRRFGDTFSVRFLGFQTPLVMLSDPEAIRALYGNASTACRLAARSRCCRSSVRARCCCSRDVTTWPAGG